MSYSHLNRLMFGPEHQYASKMEIIVVSENNADTDIDYNDFKAWFHAGPVGLLLVPKETLKCSGYSQWYHCYISHSKYVWHGATIHQKHYTFRKWKLIEIKLPELIRKHTTVKGLQDDAIEVALLTRNIVHSNAGNGFKLYPNGHFPKTEQVFSNTKAFRNKGDGVLFHNSRSLVIEGGIYADNRQQIENDTQADATRISNAIVEGLWMNFYILISAILPTSSNSPLIAPLFLLPFAFF